MTITPQQLIALLPLLIVGLTVVVVMLGIAWRRDHFINATLTVIGLNLALLSLYFVGQAGPMDVTRCCGLTVTRCSTPGWCCWRVWRPAPSRIRGWSAIRITAKSSTCWC